MTTPRTFGLCIALGAFASCAQADIINIVSNNASSSNETSYGSFTGSLQYDFIAPGIAQLSLTLTNTSNHEGKLVALAFDAATGTSGWSFDSTMSTGLSDDWSDLDGGASTEPFGDRAFGASTSNSWLGGGSPNGGLAAGATATWVFMGSGGLDVGALDFLSPNGGHNLLFRFRGFSNGASDKVPAMAVTDPIPGAAGLPAIALLGFRRRRRRG